MLLRANGNAMTTYASWSREIFSTRAFNTINYTIQRDGVKLDVPVILDAQDRSFNEGFRLIALVYLGIGLYVLFRRWTAPHSTHFYIFCLASFVLYSFKYTGQFDTFDRIIFWFNIVAEGLQPALFVHFALAFANENRRRRRALMSLVYVPGAFLVGLMSSPLCTGRQPRYFVIVSINCSPVTRRRFMCSLPSYSGPAIGTPTRRCAGSS